MANVNFNANFNKFVDWAKGYAANSEAIASASNMIGDGLVVDTKHGDGVGIFAKIVRGTTNKNINNTTRALFLDAVKEMFGGESKIPQSVKNAMRFGNFSDATTGKPLTARRIHAVKVAIDAYLAQPNNKLIENKVSLKNYGGKPDPAKTGVRIMTAATKIKASEAAELAPVKKLSLQQAREMVARSVDVLGAGDRLNAAQTENAARLLREYGRNMPPKNLRVLSNYIVNQTVNGGLSEDDVSLVAQEFKTWREFSFNDPRMNKMGEKFAQRINNTLNEYLDTKNWCMKDDPQNRLQKNVAQQFWEDAESCVWNIDGTQIGAVSDAKAVNEYKQNVLDHLLEAVKDKVKNTDKQPMVAYVLSTLLNQLIFSDMMSVVYKQPAIIGNGATSTLSEPLFSIKGGNMFVSKRSDIGMGGIVADYGKAFDLEISDDGKTATITYALDDHISSAGNTSKESRIGKVTVAEKITIDLNRPMPAVTNVTFSQKFTPDETFGKAHAIEFWA